MNQENSDDFTVFVGNLDSKVTEELLYELFLQAGPLKSVKIPFDNRTKKPQKYGFVTFKHIVSVEYAIALLNGIGLFDSRLRLSVKQKKNHSMSESEHRQNEKFSGEHTQYQNGMNHQMLPPPLHHNFSTPIPLQREPKMLMNLNNSFPIHPPYFSQNTSTPEPIQLSQSFNSPGSSMHQHHMRSDQSRNDLRRSRRSPPYSHKQSPSVNELKRNRSYQSPSDYTSRSADGRRFKNRDSPSHHQLSDTRRIVHRSRTSSRHSRHSPLNDRSRSHRY